MKRWEVLRHLMRKFESSPQYCFFLCISPNVNRYSFVPYVRIVFGHPTFVHFQKLYSGLIKHRSLSWMSSNRGVLCSSLSKSEFWDHCWPFLVDCFLKYASFWGSFWPKVVIFLRFGYFALFFLLIFLLFPLLIRCSLRSRLVYPPPLCSVDYLSTFAGLLVR